MENRCQVCATKYGIFKKEVACDRCKISLCKDCRSHIVKENQKSLSVCKKCFVAVTSGKTEDKPRSPPLSFKREMAAKYQNNIIGGGNQKQFASNQHKTTNPQLEDEDLKIAARLDKLKEDSVGKNCSVDELESRLSKLTADQKAATQQEIEYRLAKLKGDRPPVVKVHRIRKSESDQMPSSSTSDTPERQVKRLIRQYTEEVEIQGGFETGEQDEANFDPENVPEEPTADSMMMLAEAELRREQEKLEEDVKMDEEMQERLKKLQGMSPQIDCDPMDTSPTEQLSDDEEVELVRKIQNEIKLEEALDGIISSLDEKKSARPKVDEPDLDELPWCEICNEDATLRCHGCDGDLYCHRCFKEGHDNYDLSDHKTTRYIRPKNSNYD